MSSLIESSRALALGLARRTPDPLPSADPVASRWGAFLALLALVLAPIGLHGQEAGVAGRWIFSIESPEGATMQIPFVFQADGGTVTGRPDLSILPQLQADDISDGTFEDGVLSFTLRVGTAEQSVLIDVEATVDGDEMTGRAYVAEMAQSSTFTARRLPPG